MRAKPAITHYAWRRMVQNLHMDREEVKALLEEYRFFDQAVVEHGFLPYNRDYRVVAEISGQRSPGAKVEVLERYSLLFRGCVEIRYTSNVKTLDLDDVFIDHDRWERAGQPAGFVWGVNWADAYPGLRYVDASERVASWQQRLGRPMHEVLIETNTYDLVVVFAELSAAAEKLPPSEAAPREAS